MDTKSNPANIAPQNTALLINCDGGSRGNPGPGASAFVAQDKSGKIIHQEGKYLGHTTNNLAEYNAVLLSLTWLKGKINVSLIPDRVSLFLDSRLAVSQLNGLFKVKDSNIREIIMKIKILENEIKTRISYKLIPREQNYRADLLVNQTLDQSLH